MGRRFGLFKRELDVSHLLELLGRGLDSDLGDLLDRYFWSPGTKSMEELEESCLGHPDWPDLRLQLGLAHLRASQFDQAAEHLLHACRRKPDYLAARLALASALDEKGDTQAALEHLAIANQNSPGEAAILFAIGFCSEKMRRPREAAEYYRDAVRRDPAMIVARERLAAVAVTTGDADEAIRQYQALRELRPEDPWVHGALAHLYYRAGQYGQAVEEFESAIAMEPENWTLIDDEVEALVADGLVREAIERLHSLLEQQGPFADLHCRLADLYSQIGDDEAATKHYLLALDSQPNFLEAHVRLGTHHLAFGRWEQATEAFLRATELNEALLAGYVGIGVAQAAAGDRAEAINCFELAAAVEPNSTLLLTEVARLHLKAAAAEVHARNFATYSEPPVAEVDLDHDDLLAKQVQRHAEEVQAHPGYADLRYRYGVLLRSEGRLGESIEQFAKAVEINPTYVQAIIKLGITQQELGMVDEAIDTFKRALDIRPQFVDLHYRLGLLYTDRRQFEEAVRHMEIAAGGAADNEQIRAGLALSLQNMGLLDRATATWRSLWRIHHPKAAQVRG